MITAEEVSKIIVVLEAVMNFIKKVDPNAEENQMFVAANECISILHKIGL